MVKFFSGQSDFQGEGQPDLLLDEAAEVDGGSCQVRQTPAAAAAGGSDPAAAKTRCPGSSHQPTPCDQHFEPFAYQAGATRGSEAYGYG